MKIAILAYSSLPLIGGSQIFTFNLIKNLLARSHQVHFYLPYRYSNVFQKLFSHERLHVFPVFRFEGFFSKYLPDVIASTLMMRQLIHKYDVWQIIGAYPAGCVVRLLSGRVPLVLRSHGDDIQKSNSLQYGARRNRDVENKIRLALSYMTRLVALTNSVTACYEELGVPRRKIEEIPNGVDFERFQPQIDSENVRTSLGISKEERFLLTVGRYHIKKGYEYIPDAAKQLISKGYYFKWVLVGKGVGKLEQMIKRNKLENFILLHEEVESQKISGVTDYFQVPSQDIIDLYRSADIFVAPSLLETFGMVLIEAMAAGTPVVTTDAPGCRDVVSHGVNGLQAQAADSGSLAFCIESLLNDAPLVNRLTENALKMVRSYDWAEISRRYEKLYCDII